jgi:hypothetical protein
MLGYMWLVESYVVFVYIFHFLYAVAYMEGGS